MLAFRKCCSVAAGALSKSLYQWRHAQTKQVVEGILGRGTWGAVEELQRSTWRLPSWPHTTPTSPFLRPMLLLPTRGAKHGVKRGTASPTTKPKNSAQHDKSQHLDVKSTSDLFVRWEIPWGGKVVGITMTAVGISFLFTPVLARVICLDFMQAALPADLDKMFLIFFTNLLLQNLVGPFVMKACIKRYSFLPKGFFSYDWRDPFSARRGWLLWGVVGTICCFPATLLARTVIDMTGFSRAKFFLFHEGLDILGPLLSSISSSGVSSALLLFGAVGILAPIIEEIVFRGFLLTSLTKWVPTYVAVLGSAGAFALVHLNPAQLPELFALGVVFGFSYAKTGNLLTPIMIHGLWNSAMIALLLLLLHLGYDIRKVLEDPKSIFKGPVKQAPHLEGKD